MTVKSGQQWTGLIRTKDTNGALATPSIGPAGTLYVDGVANGASVTVTGSNPYKWTVTLPTLTAGQTVSMDITATIATIATASVVAEDVADTKRVSDLNDSAYAGGAVASVAGDIGGKVLGGGAGVLAGVGVQADMQQMDGSETPVDNLVLSIGSDGHIKANLMQILGTTLTETVAGYLAAAFKKFFNKATPTGTINSLPDAVAGAAGGVAIVGSEMGLANDAITAGKFDESTAFPLKFADTGTTKLARVGADSDTLETLSDQLDAIQAITDDIDTSTVTVTTSNNAGDLTIKRTATFAATVSGLVIPADWTAVLWTVKGAASDEETDAVLQVRVSNPSAPLTDGLQRIDGAAPSGSLTIASGSCTVNQAGGTVALALTAAATAALTARGDAAWDLRVLRPTDVAEELTTGTADIQYTVTHTRT